MAQSELSPVEACVFDAYGTLFDFRSAARASADIPRDAADRLTALWRDKQLQYTWLRAVQGRHADFWHVTSPDFSRHIGIIDVGRGWSSAIFSEACGLVALLGREPRWGFS